MQKSLVSKEQADEHIQVLVDICRKLPDQAKMVIRSPQLRRRKFYAALEHEFGVVFQPDNDAGVLSGLSAWLLGYPVLVKTVRLDKALALCSRLMEQSLLEVLLLPAGFESGGGAVMESAFLVYMVDEDSAEQDEKMVECMEVRETCPASVREMLSS